MHATNQPADRMVTPNAARAEQALAEFVITRNEPGSMDASWATAVTSMLNDFLLDGPANVAFYRQPDRPTLGGRPTARVWAVTGRVIGSSEGDTVTFADGSTVDVTDYTTCAVAAGVPG